MALIKVLSARREGRLVAGLTLALALPGCSMPIPGLLDPSRRTDAALIAWIAVHGLSTLLVDHMVELGLGIEDDHATRAVLDCVLRSIVTPGAMPPGR